MGSNAEFSEVLRELEREVSPLWPLRLCPRDFKKTSSERHFRSKGFLVDWCSFKLVLYHISLSIGQCNINLLFILKVPQNTSLLVLSSAAPPNVDFKTDRTELVKTNKVLSEEWDTDIWNAPAKYSLLNLKPVYKIDLSTSFIRWEIPRRSYTEEGVVAVFIPLVMLLILAALLTAVLGVHPEGAEPEEGQVMKLFSWGDYVVRVKIVNCNIFLHSFTKVYLRNFSNPNKKSEQLLKSAMNFQLYKE